MATKRIGIASDHGGFDLKKFLKSELLKELGPSATDAGLRKWQILNVNRKT